jgi:hypothetical protein
MCFSPLRRKTSELEGEEEYSRLISRNLRDRPATKLNRQRLHDLIWLPSSAQKQ